MYSVFLGHESTIATWGAWLPLPFIQSVVKSLLIVQLQLYMCPSGCGNLDSGEEDSQLLYTCVHATQFVALPHLLLCAGTLCIMIIMHKQVTAGDMDYDMILVISLETE